MKNIKLSGAGGKWILAMLVYFTFFIALNGTVNLVGEDSVSNYASGVTSLTETNGTCQVGRYIVDPDTSTIYDSDVEYYDIPISVRFYLGFQYYGIESHTSCEYSTGALSETGCNSTSGCGWTGSACDGDINMSYYGVNTTTTFFPGIYPKVERHENTGFFQDASPCNHPDVISNEESCKLLDCKWLEDGTQEYADAMEESRGVKQLYNNIKTIFSFSKTFNTDSTTLNFVLGVIFVILPLLILALSLWFVFNPVK